MLDRECLEVVFRGGSIGRKVPEGSCLTTEDCCDQPGNEGSVYEPKEDTSCPTSVGSGTVSEQGIYE